MGRPGTGSGTGCGAGSGTTARNGTDIATSATSDNSTVTVTGSATGTDHRAGAITLWKQDQCQVPLRRQIWFVQAGTIIVVEEAAAYLCQTLRICASAPLACANSKMGIVITTGQQLAQPELSQRALLRAGAASTCGATETNSTLARAFR